MVQHHPSSTDPFFLTKVLNRTNVYGDAGMFEYYPTFIVDGLKRPAWASGLIDLTEVVALVNERLPETTPITIQYSGQGDAGSSSKADARIYSKAVASISSTINYTFVISSEEVIQSQNLKFLIFVLETNRPFNAPNGLNIHNNIVRDIIPDEYGVPVDFSDTGNLTVTVQGSYNVDPRWGSGNVFLVGILQDIETREVYQSIDASSTLGISSKDTDIKPKEFELTNVFPNPFNPSVNIEFAIANEDKVSLSIHNLTGVEVDVLFTEKTFDQGQYIFKWDGKDFPSGTYFFKMKSKNGISIKKAILLK